MLGRWFVGKLGEEPIDPAEDPLRTVAIRPAGTLAETRSHPLESAHQSSARDSNWREFRGRGQRVMGVTGRRGKPRVPRRRARGAFGRAGNPRRWCLKIRGLRCGSGASAERGFGKRLLRVSPFALGAQRTWNGAREWVAALRNGPGRRVNSRAHVPRSLAPGRKNLGLVIVDEEQGKTGLKPGRDASVSWTRRAIVAAKTGKCRRVAGSATPRFEGDLSQLPPAASHEMPSPWSRGKKSFAPRSGNCGSAHGIPSRPNQTSPISKKF